MRKRFFYLSVLVSKPFDNLKQRESKGSHAEAPTPPTANATIPTASRLPTLVRQTPKTPLNGRAKTRKSPWCRHPQHAHHRTPENSNNYETSHRVGSRGEEVVHLSLRVRITRLHHETVASRDGHVVVVPCAPRETNKDARGRFIQERAHNDAWTRQPSRAKNPHVSLYATGACAHDAQQADTLLPPCVERGGSCSR